MMIDPQGPQPGRARQDQSGTERYTYDTFGNLTQQTEALLGFSYATQYAYDTANQLSQMTWSLVALYRERAVPRTGARLISLLETRRSYSERIVSPSRKCLSLFENPVPQSSVR
jgi:hypothetical protein